jgi:small multidrug resistance pump
MHPLVAAYGALALAIVTEVGATSLLIRTEQFSRIGLTALMIGLYVCSFYFVTLSLKTLPLGLAYAIWAGCGIVLSSVIGAVVFRQSLDLAALVGITLIVSGVIVIHAFSRSVGSSP